MANSKMTDLSALMHNRPTGAAPALPGVHGARVAAAPPVAEPEVDEEAPAVEVEAAPAEDESTPSAPAADVEDTETAKPVKQAPAKKAAKPQDPEPAEAPAEADTVAEPQSPAKKSAAKRTTPAKKKVAPAAKEAKAGEEPNEEEQQELVSLDGRPARLWDISGGKELPEGWARTALERVSKASRHFRADRRNTTLPDNIYDACNAFIYQEGKAGGLDLTLSNLAEAAYEQIPNDDEAGITRLLDGLPDKYFEKGLATRPRTFQLFEPTLEHMQNLARMLRAFGFTGKTGLVQTAALRELLLDLGVTVDDD